MVGVMQGARGDCDEEYGAALDECARAALRTQFPHTVNDLCNAYLAFTVAQVRTDRNSNSRILKPLHSCYVEYRLRVRARNLHQVHLACINPAFTCKEHCSDYCALRLSLIGRYP
jgi:hypothetical protein